MSKPFSDKLPGFLTRTLIAAPQSGRHPWWRRRRRISRRRVRANFRWLFFRHPKSATLIINVRLGLLE